ncbi:DUF6551 family protein [Nocardia sp. NPDC050408]|uniref:DUF6551 family protein n=1 Tax=Nocardia sp. NPDC050408 TaxID=3364319 RepID=UPI0037BCEBDE
MNSNTAVLERPPAASAAVEHAEESNVYIAAISVRDIFADHTYQRDLDLPRARAMAEKWDVHKVGVIDVSDRGTDSPDRYAVINGQHRWSAARLVDPDYHLVANVHTGLTVAEEASLFYGIDAGTRRLTTWDRWNARRGALDPIVTAIESVVTTVGLAVDQSPQNGSIRCTSTLEKVHKLGGQVLLENTLRLIVEVWGHRLDAVDYPLVHGVALILHCYDTVLDHDRFGEVLIDFAPRQIKARAQALRETEKGQFGKLAALVMINAYNSSRGPKLDRTHLGRSDNNGRTTSSATPSRKERTHT